MILIPKPEKDFMRKENDRPVSLKHRSKNRILSKQNSAICKEDNISQDFLIMFLGPFLPSSTAITLVFLKT